MAENEVIVIEDKTNDTKLCATCMRVIKWELPECWDCSKEE